MRYFIEVAYKGTRYNGFQIQNNAVTIQGELEKALLTLFRHPIVLTGSSRTDAGVHAMQNYFHFDTELTISDKLIYKLNAILPFDIVVKNIKAVAADAHCRFDATTREYLYSIYHSKNPFLSEIAYYFPYTIDSTLLEQAASRILGRHDFSSFSKRNTQVKTFFCTIEKAQWHKTEHGWDFQIIGNRFLRGMVRGLVATMLKVGRSSITIEEFDAIIAACDCSKADFSSPGKGLFLMQVNYPENQFTVRENT